MILNPFGLQERILFLQELERDFRDARESTFDELLKGQIENVSPDSILLDPDFLTQFTESVVGLARDLGSKIRDFELRAAVYFKKKLVLGEVERFENPFSPSNREMATNWFDSNVANLGQFLASKLASRAPKEKRKALYSIGLNVLHSISIELGQWYEEQRVAFECEISTIRQMDRFASTEDGNTGALDAGTHSQLNEPRLQDTDPTEYVTLLKQLARAIDDAKVEIDLARQQSTTSMHLCNRAERAVIQASRAVVAAFDAGFDQLLPGGWWWIPVLRNVQVQTSPATTANHQRSTAQLKSVQTGSQTDGKETLSDDNAFAIWLFYLCPAIRSGQLALKGRAGEFDFPAGKVDPHGRVLGRDGKPFELVGKFDSDTGRRIGWHEKNPAERITDDYDDACTLEHVRCQAADWSDACRIAAERIREEAKINARKLSHRDVTGDGHRLDNKSQRSEVDESHRQHVQPLEASEELRPTYCDPPKYWRNVWLYEQRKAGKRNNDILQDLENHNEGFAPLTTANSLRNAIEAIAQYHGWPMLKGRPGRPPANRRSPSKDVTIG